MSPPSYLAPLIRHTIAITYLNALQAGGTGVAVDLYIISGAGKRPGRAGLFTFSALEAIGAIVFNFVSET